MFGVTVPCGVPAHEEKMHRYYLDKEIKTPSVLDSS